MDIIDKVEFTDIEDYDAQDLSDAYKELFASDSRVAEIVMSDLIKHVNYGSQHVAIEPTIEYHANGMKAVVRHIKVMLNKEANKLPTENDDVSTELIEE